MSNVIVTSISVQHAFTICIYSCENSFYQQQYEYHFSQTKENMNHTRQMKIQNEKDTLNKIRSRIICIHFS